jgi:gamma-glutamyl phosphate reductase
MQAKLNDYCGFVQRQFEALGNWTMNHQFMLNTFLQERFLMAELIDNAQRDIQNANNANMEQLQGFQRLKGEAATYVGLLEGIRRVVAENKPVSEIVSYVEQFDLYRSNLSQLVSGIKAHMQVLGDLNIQD